MKKLISLTLILIVAIGCLFTGCTGGKEKIVIWTSGEDYKNEHYLARLEEQFPDYDITLEYMSSSTIAAKIKEEGALSECDIILSQEYSYLDMCEDVLVELTDFDFSPFLDDIVPASKKYSPELRNGGCIIVNKTILAQNNLEAPKSYNDLLDAKYKKLIAMPNPASSGTGYMFLRQLVNQWGESEAFDYFSKLTANIWQYTSSGSGPVNAIVQGEVAIGLGMTAQAVVEKNNGVDLEIIFFEDGSPFSMYGNAIVKKEEVRASVTEVFNFLSTTLVKENNDLFNPEQIFKDHLPEVKGFPKNIAYGDMSNSTITEKERLLKKWTFA